MIKVFTENVLLLKQSNNENQQAFSNNFDFPLHGLFSYHFVNCYYCEQAIT